MLTFINILRYRLKAGFSWKAALKDAYRTARGIY